MSYYTTALPETETVSGRKTESAFDRTYDAARRDALDRIAAGETVRSIELEASREKLPARAIGLTAGAALAGIAGADRRRSATDLESVETP